MNIVAYGCIGCGVAIIAAYTPVLGMVVGLIAYLQLQICLEEDDVA